MTSSAGYPNVLSAARLNSRTRPPSSMATTQSRASSRRAAFRRSDSARRDSTLKRNPLRLLEESSAHALGDRSRALGDPELVVDRLEVRLDGRGAEMDALRDIGSRVPGRH